MIKFDEEALMCDLAEIYHIYDYKQLSPLKIAVFSIGLNEESRIKMKMSGQKFPINTLLLAGIQDRLSMSLWFKTEMVRKVRTGQNLLPISSINQKKKLIEKSDFILVRILKNIVSNYFKKEEEVNGNRIRTSLCANYAICQRNIRFNVWDIRPEAESAGNSAGLKIGSALKVAAIAGVVATGAALGKLISSSLSEGADLQQSLGGVETLFKDNADKVKKYATEGYRTAGMSANTYMETVTGFSASMIKSLNGDTAKAADLSNQAIVDMSDNANKMGTNVGDIQNAYQGFAKQNYTMLDNLKLGYGGTKEEMQRLLTDAQKLTGQKYDISNFSDITQAIHAIQTEMDITGTTAKEASTTFSGSFNSMKAAMSNVLGNLSLGRDLQGPLNALASTTSTFLFKNFIPMVGNIFKALPGAISTFVSAAGKELSSQLGNGIGSGSLTLLQSSARYYHPYKEVFKLLSQA
ncbi:hypothetical protein ICE98_03289 [Lactococcus lactis]|nr:hypothetical protein [Lactococcus lactis]